MLGAWWRYNVGRWFRRTFLGLGTAPDTVWSLRCPHGQQIGRHCIGCHNAKMCRHYR